MFDAFVSTARSAFHWLRTNPRFAAPAVLSLALGFGGTAVMFSVLWATFYPPQPFPAPDRVMIARMYQPSTDTHTPGTTADYNDFKAMNSVFESMGLFLPLSQPMTVSGDGLPERVLYQYVTASMFPLLGVRARLGRTFEDGDVASPSVLLSEEFWKRRYNSDPGIIGKTIRLGGLNYQVLGVMPEGFHISGVKTDVFRQTDPTGVLNERRVRWLMITGRLKPGVTQAQAQENMASIAAQLAKTYPDTNRGWTIHVSPLSEYGANDLARRLYPFIGAVVFVLLIACTNVTGLLLAHSAGRKKELATRAAIGASRGILVRQLIAESIALSIVSGIVAVFVARWWLGLVIAYAPLRYEFIRLSSLDLRVFLFVLGVSLFTGTIMGSVVAWRSSRLDVNNTLKDHAGGVTSGKRQRALSVLAVVEIALAFVLLVGAGLLLRTVNNLHSAPLGFDIDNVLTGEIDLSGPTYRGRIFRRDVAIVPIQPATPLFHERLLTDLARLPTVESVGLASWLPLAQLGSGRRNRSFQIAGKTELPRGERPEVMYNAVTPGFFSTLRIPLVRGRLITDRDTFAAPWVVLINRTMADQFFPNEDPIGKTLTLDTVEEERPREIVGVVEDIHQFMDRTRPPRAEMFVNVFQQPAVYPGDGAQTRFRLAVLMRARPSQSLIADMRRTVAQIDSTQPVFQIRTMQEIHAQRDAGARFVTLILALFAGLGTVLAALGVFALVSYAAANRAQEFSIRLALGATTGSLLRMLLVWSGVVAGLGIGIGVLVAVWQTRFLRAQLFGVTPLDMTTFVLAALLIVGVALAAALQSARRVRRVDAVTVLRG